MDFNEMIEIEIKKSFKLLGKNFDYRVGGENPASYIELKNFMKIDGMGFVKAIIAVKPNWYVLIALFLDSNINLFIKVLLMEKVTNNLFNKCHSIYVDEADLSKGGGTNTQYTYSEVIASLINHALTHSPENCESCAGNSKFQTHIIQLYQKFDI